MCTGYLVLLIVNYCALKVKWAELKQWCGETATQEGGGVGTTSSLFQGMDVQCIR